MNLLYIIGAKDKAKEIPGWGQPRWGGRSFGDSVASNNIWGLYIYIYIYIIYLSLSLHISLSLYSYIHIYIYIYICIYTNRTYTYINTHMYVYHVFMSGQSRPMPIVYYSIA